MALIDTINSPQDLKQLPLPELETLAGELRAQIIETVNRNGGHLASPLGVVELTIALHYVYNIGADKLIWDVGHQCYAHKLLTGRRERFDSLRKRDGISGYPKISESLYDCFGTGHSSTSISAALGMAIARDMRAEDHHVVALIGDGAITGGMALEALSNAGHLGVNLLVILNDNEMSISRNTGALAHCFNRIITAAPYKRAKEDVGSFVKQLIGDRMTRTIQDLEKSLKGFITKGAFFQELGVNYIGPVDGHDLPLLIACLERIKTMKGPILLHCRTEKGKGLKEAEEDPQTYHGVKPLSLNTRDTEGDPLPARKAQVKAAAKSFTDAFAQALLALAREDERVVGITAAMPTGTGLAALETEFPDRFFDVGICEQHAVTLAGGLAVSGMRPVAAIYSTFLQRGYDQLIHDICIQNLPVIFAIDRAGLVGEDSPTQNGTFDLSYLRLVPNMCVMAPRDDIDTQLMLRWAMSLSGPAAIRYARGPAPSIGTAEGRGISRGEILRHGDDAVFLSVGPVASACIAAAERLAEEGYSIGVADARFVKPLDTALIDSLAGRPIITVEENTLEGGFGSAVLEYFAGQGRLEHLRLLRLGVPDAFIEQGTREEQLALCGLDCEGLVQSAQRFLGARAHQMAK